MRPRLFIGSSVEGLSIAYAVQQNLHHSAEVTVWDQGVFKLSSTTLASLVAVLDTSDFGIFVFSSDDLLILREKKYSSVRDNVLFELGLFIGRLGKDRCFILVPDEADDFRIPTDLLGITPASYETDRTDGSMQAATGPACHQIRQQIVELGTFRQGADALSLPIPEASTMGEIKLDQGVNELETRILEVLAGDAINDDRELNKEDLQSLLQANWVRFKVALENLEREGLIETNSAFSNYKSLSVKGGRYLIEKGLL